MITIGLDPGPSVSTLVAFNGQTVIGLASEANRQILDRVQSPYDLFGRWGANGGTDAVPVLVIEQIESFGMAVGRETFETVFWSGRFAEAWSPARFERLPRRIIKQHICHTARATDANIRQELIDRFGGQVAAIGKKSNPGPLYHVKSHAWAALAIAITWYDQFGHLDPVRPGLNAEF